MLKISKEKLEKAISTSMEHVLWSKEFGDDAADSFYKMIEPTPESERDEHYMLSRKMCIGIDKAVEMSAHVTIKVLEELGVLQLTDHLDE